MKNVLKHSNGSQSLLANVDDDTNRIFINDAEIPSSLWVGSGTYTQSIDGVMISITKISDLSGNIMLQKVSDNHYQLVRKTETASIPFSHIGQIIESTTLDSLDKVQAIYGSNTMWIQHTGYILRGASSGVTANQAQKDGGSDNAIVPYHNHTFTGTTETYKSTTEDKNHTHVIPALSGTALSGGAHTHNVITDIPLVLNVAGRFQVGSGPYTVSDSVHNPVTLTAESTGSAHTHAVTTEISTTSGISNNHTHEVSIQPKGTISYEGTNGNTTNANIPNYKNVYIWERTA